MPAAPLPPAGQPLHPLQQRCGLSCVIDCLTNVSDRHFRPCQPSASDSDNPPAERKPARLTPTPCRPADRSNRSSRMPAAVAAALAALLFIAAATVAEAALPSSRGDRGLIGYKEDAGSSRPRGMTALVRGKGGCMSGGGRGSRRPGPACVAVQTINMPTGRLYFAAVVEPAHLPLLPLPVGW